MVLGEDRYFHKGTVDSFQTEEETTGIDWLFSDHLSSFVISSQPLVVSHEMSQYPANSKTKQTAEYAEHSPVFQRLGENSIAIHNLTYL